MTLGERVKSLRQKNSLTQEELAKEIGYATKTSISKIENDILDINQSTIVALARALKTTPSVIMGWEEPNENIDQQGNGIMYKRFVELLQERGMTAYRVSKETGVAQTTLSDWKTGRATPQIDTLQEIADYFDVSLDWLIGNTDYRKGQVYSANKDISMVARHLEDIPDEDRKAVIDTIEKTIELYLKARHHKED